MHDQSTGAIYNKIAYYDWQGTSLDFDEQKDIAAVRQLDFILDHPSRMSQRCTTPRAPCAYTRSSLRVGLKVLTCPAYPMRRAT